ncbi:MAG: bifunctional phosphopantothenoylcysteine decarboxylase/phosphopantothenate--cysteine ligase CoaBC [Chitinophagaceae bacterium]
MLSGKKILLGITGSIAAYKSIFLVRLLIKHGAEVRVIITPAAKDFVSPLVLSTLSKNKVLFNLFDEDEWQNHVMLGCWADVFLIAPLSCNTLAKMATGQCDNLLLAVYLSATCPVIVAPAMDEDMWHHPSTRKNIDLLQSFGNKIFDVENGELASGLTGEGRMAEPEKIVEYLQQFFFESSVLKNKKVLITAGPTYEAIDPVRFISNHSSGKMGFALAEVFYKKGAEVILITGPTHEKTSNKKIKIINITTAEEMYDNCMKEFPSVDIAVFSAAVADYKSLNVSAEKIKKKDEEIILHLTKTKDILQSLGAIKKQNQIVVGFALETNNERKNALQKLKTKNADFIVLNSTKNANATFGFNTNKVTIFDKNENEFESELLPKQKIAEFIVDTIIQKKS